MPKSIYSRRGDKGKTGLLTGERIEKTDPRIEAYGTVDELIASLGIAKIHSSERIAKFLQDIQQRLFFLAAELATPQDSFQKEEKIVQGIERIIHNDIFLLENIADELTEELPPISSFIIPGGSESAVFLHQSRTICRRAERRVISFSKIEEINPEIIRYLNRLSDLLFVMARYENITLGNGDQLISRQGLSHQKKE
ncbi:MAG: cob(I)yrinic acid a,c-diamide adenosyltransferase [Candidatus Hodarchaeota archaeon]